MMHAIFLIVHVSSGTVRKNEIEGRLQRGLPVNAAALAKEFLVSEDAIRRDLRALAAEASANGFTVAGFPYRRMEFRSSTDS